MVLFTVLLVAQYFAARHSTQALYITLSRVLPHPLPFIVIAFLFFPGTLIHELAHFFAAIILFLKVRGLHLLPSWSHNHLELGHVTYIKADFLRGFLVGVAPLPVSLISLWAAYEWLIVRGGENWHWVLFFYITFTVTSSMFASPSDLTDGAAFLVFLVVVGVVLYFFSVDIRPVIEYLLAGQGLFGPFFTVMTLFLGISLAIHLAIIVLLRFVVLRFFVKG